MDVERALVSKVAQSQSMTEVMERELDSTHFLQRTQGDMSPEPLPGEVFAYINTQLSRFKAMPSYDLIKMRFPTFEFVDDSNPLKVLVEEFVKIVKRRHLIESIRSLSVIADDPTKWSDAELFVFEVAAELSRAVPSSSVTRLSASLNRLNLHKQMQEEGRAPGISLIAPDLDALTYGIQPGELCIWQGFLGVGKSTCAMMQSAKEYLERDKTSLVLSLEMEGEKLANRWDAAMAGFHYRALKFSEMRDSDYEAWARFAEKAYEARFDKDVIVIDNIARCTSEKIFNEVEKWRPDFFIVDTIDEIAAPKYIKSHWEKGDFAARELKMVCRASKIPGIGVAQAGRDAEEEGATLNNMAQSITIARKADIVVGLHATPQMKRANQIEMRMLKNRDGDGDGLAYSYYKDPAKLLLRPWTPADAVAKPPSQQAQAGVPAGAGTNSFGPPV